MFMFMFVLFYVLLVLAAYRDNPNDFSWLWIVPIYIYKLLASRLNQRKTIVLISVNFCSQFDNECEPRNAISSSVINSLPKLN